MYKKELLYKHKDLHLTPPPSVPILKSQAEWPTPVSQCWGGRGQAAQLCCEEEEGYGIELSRQHRRGSADRALASDIRTQNAYLVSDDIP